MNRKVYRRVLLLIMVVYCCMWCLTYVSVCQHRGPGGKCLDILDESETGTTMSTRQLTTTGTPNFTIPTTVGPFDNALLYGMRRPNKGFLTIGIPTMERPANQTYLWATLDSLISNSNDEEKNDTVIVIFLSDFDTKTKEILGKSIAKKYGIYIDSGLIQIIQAPYDFYPSLDNLKRTYGHPMKQVKWRSKQNIDYAFMMRYSANISEYYIQLEDDVTTVSDFIPKIKYYMMQQGKRPWICLEYSELGYIGKLYHSSDLEKLAQLLTLFYNEQPNDVTYLHFNQLMTQFKRKVIRPTIFQHHGYHSTLVIKKSKLKDKFFKMPEPVTTQAEKIITEPEPEMTTPKAKSAPVPQKAKPAPVPQKAKPAPVPQKPKPGKKKKT